MIDLFVAETMRIRSRRTTWIALLAVLAGTLLVVWSASQASAPVSEAEMSQASSAYQQALNTWEADKDTCSPPDSCPKPKLENFVRATGDYGQTMQDVVLPSAYFCFLASMVIAASLIAAEFATGAISNLLSFVPNRVRVYAAKVSAIVVASAVVSTVILTFAAVSATLMFLALRGTETMGADSTWLAMAGRGVAAGIFGGLVGASLAFVLRHTAAVIGIVLGYTFLSGGIYMMVAGLKLYDLFRFMPDIAMHAFVQGEYNVNIWGGSDQIGASSPPMGYVITAVQGAGFWIAFLAVLVTISLLVFRRRDVS